MELDERWLFDLAKDPEGRKPTVTWQSYNRSGVPYESYDEMFISLLPRNCLLYTSIMNQPEAPTLRILFKTEKNKQYLALKVIPPCVVSGF